MWPLPLWTSPHLIDWNIRMTQTIERKDGSQLRSRLIHKLGLVFSFTLWLGQRRSFYSWSDDNVMMCTVGVKLSWTNVGWLQRGCHVTLCQCECYGLAGLFKKNILIRKQSWKHLSLKDFRILIKWFGPIMANVYILNTISLHLFAT